MFVGDAFTCLGDKVGGVNVKHDPGNPRSTLLRAGIELRHGFHVFDGPADLHRHHNAVTRVIRGNAFTDGSEARRNPGPEPLVAFHQVRIVEKAARGDDDGLRAEDLLAFVFRRGFHPDDGTVFRQKLGGSGRRNDGAAALLNFFHHAFGEECHRTVFRRALEGLRRIHLAELDAVGLNEFDNLRGVFRTAVQDCRIVLRHARVDDGEAQIVSNLVKRFIVHAGFNLLPVVFDFDVLGDAGGIMQRRPSAVELPG